MNRQKSSLFQLDLPVTQAAPSSPGTPDPAGALWGMVIQDSGACIAGASVRVVGGQGLGRSAAQQQPCGAWDYDGGFVLAGLTPGVAMTLCVSAPGSVAEDTTVVPRLDPQTALLITPSRE
jgi:hypothetical protein